MKFNRKGKKENRSPENRSRQRKNRKRMAPPGAREQTKLYIANIKKPLPRIRFDPQLSIAMPCTMYPVNKDNKPTNKRIEMAENNGKFGYNKFWNQIF